jgi:DNA-directed RNA polymerase specialized sigma24 family protein
MQRTLLGLRIEGYDLPEIEAITGVDRKVLSQRLHRARQSLARHLLGQTPATQDGRRTGSNQ